MKSFGVSPIQPLFERIADQAVLNCEFTFETEQETLTLQGWKSVATYVDGSTKETAGTGAEFWQNIVALTVTPPGTDITKEVVANHQIPGSTRVLVYFPHTDYPAAQLPVSIAVSMSFHDEASRVPQVLEFSISPKMHHGVKGYIFPVGWSVADKLPPGQEWSIRGGNGHELPTGHRRYFEWTPFDGFDPPPHNSQKYAHDLVITDSTRRTMAKEPPTTLADYYCYGKNVYAAATGVLTYVERDVADTAIGGKFDRDDPAGGNGVIIDTGRDEFFVYAHLQQGSLPVGVQVDKKVYKGQLIGRLGNSGSSSEPHLHFQAQDGGVYARGDGLPSTVANIALRRGGAQGFTKWATGIPSDCAIRVVHSPGAFVGVFRTGTGGQSFTVGEDFATFGKTIDKAFAQGLRLTSVQRFEVGGQARFLGVFRTGTGGQSFTVGEDFATFGKTIDKAFAQGLRLTSVQRFEVGGQARFLGVFRTGTGGQSFTVGEDFATFGKTIDKAFAQGLRLTSVQRFEVGGQARFLGVFRTGTGGQSFTVGEDFATFGKTIDKAFAQGLRLTSVQRFEVGGQARFLGVFRTGTGGQSFTVGEDFATFGAAIDMMAAEGFYLTSVQRFD